MNIEKSFTIDARDWSVDYRVTDEGRLLQTSFTSNDENCKDLTDAFPAAGNGWIYEPAAKVTHADGNTSSDFRVTEVSQAEGLTTVVMKDPVFPVTLTLHFQALPEVGVIECWTSIEHSEPGSVKVECLASSSIDFGKDDYWLTQFHGDWANEANLAEEKLGYGIKVLDSKLAVRAHQFRAPWFILSRGQEAAEDSGEVFGGSLAWSGSFRFAFEKEPSGSLRAICGVNPYGSTYVLESGRILTLPKMVWAFSSNGTGELSRRLHRYVRENALRDGNEPRAILLNNWEATYFNFDENKIASLFDGARDLGMELFLLDDGWFGTKYPRNDDKQGLGDWTPDKAKLPNGVSILAEKAVEKGLLFGLWFEPEMVNPRSELFETHPEWAIQQPSREFDLHRNQMILDLTNPEVEQYVFSVVDDVLTTTPGITYVKWDCNRYVTQPGSSYLPAESQSNLSIDYVNALYRVFEKLIAKHPHVEIMMCSGGGGRVDYGALKFAHEVWPSDMTDAVRRIFIQWGYSFFFPAISTANHVTRWGSRPMQFSFDVAMSGRMGMDIDVDKCTASEREVAIKAIANYKRIRDVVQLGDLYRLESPYAGVRSSLMYGYGKRAVVFVFARGDVEEALVRLKGLEPNGDYSVKLLDGEAAGESFLGVQLMEIGLAVPSLGCCESRVFEISQK